MRIGNEQGVYGEAGPHKCACGERFSTRHMLIDAAAWNDLGRPPLRVYCPACASLVLEWRPPEAPL